MATPATANFIRKPQLCQTGLRGQHINILEKKNANDYPRPSIYFIIWEKGCGGDGDILAISFLCFFFYQYIQCKQC